MNTSTFKVDILGRTTVGLAGKDIEFPLGPCEVETHFVEVEPGGAIGRHRHPGPCWMHVVEGKILTESDDGTQQTFVAGETFVEDAWEWVDNRNPGSTPAKFLAVVVGNANEPKVLTDESEA